MEQLEVGRKQRLTMVPTRRMDGAPAQPAAITFVVRIWPEWSLSGPRWRGRIEHLQSGRTLAFHDLEEALAFIRASGVFAGEQHGDSDDELPMKGVSNDV
ncbi:MAG TPA: hypothetical protein VF177_01830 [Anaerolineae bacterium]